MLFLLYTHKPVRVIMRTNIVIDNKLIKQAMHNGGYKTKKETIAAALEHLVRYQKQAKIRAYRGKLKWEGDLNKLREDK